MEGSKQSADFLVVGGGVAGICCAQSLAETNADVSIILVTAKDVVKLVTNSRKLTRTLEEITVEEKPSLTLCENHPNIHVIHDMIVTIDPEKSIAYTKKGSGIKYKKLCICTGAKPNLIDSKSEFVLGIRDVESVAELQKRLKNATRIIVIGNGGIALELVYELSGCEVIWAIKDEAIGNVFLDKAASEFLLPTLSDETDKTSCQQKEDSVIFKRRKYEIEREMKAKDANDSCEETNSVYGGALGPDWSLNTRLKGIEQEPGCRHVHINYNCEIRRIMDPDQFQQNNSQVSELPNRFSNGNKNWNVYVELTSGNIYGADLIVSATGVKPNTEFQIIDSELALSDDGGIKVDENMRTNLANVYAAGDACHASWEHSDNWFQMRLWTQAHQMGLYTAKCMMGDFNNEEVVLDFCFELFAHVTSFFGYKLCLLGRYNAQGLRDHELIVRYTRGKEYVKVILKDGRMVGALLLGETDLEETFENLILNEMDLSQFGEGLLDPDIEIEDFFD